MKRVLGLGCVLILLAQLTVQVKLARLDSQTTDEAAHLSAGYSYLTKHDYRYNPEHPPLVKTLAALPLLALRPHEPADGTELWDKAGSFFYDSWQENRRYGEELLYGQGNDAATLLFWARMPMVLLTLLLGLSILFIAWRHWGPWAGLGAVSFYAFDPTINAHGHLITTDIGAALGYLLTFYTAWQLTEKITWRSAIAFGAALGLALLMKHTMIIALPALLLLLVVRVFIKHDWGLVGKLLPKLGVSLVVGWIVIWAGFGFQDRALPQTPSITNELKLVTRSPAVDRLYQISHPLLRLLPSDYVKGVILVVNHTSSGQGAFLLGQESSSGWWYYFPLLFLFKTPLPTLLLVAIGLYRFAKERSKDWLLQTLLIGASVFLIFACLSHTNLGIRHIVPLYPFLFVLIGYTVATARQGPRIFLGLVVWLALLFGLVFPGYLGYFNPLVGGSANGSNIATDSNLDWGQDLGRIKKYIHDQQLQQPFVQYNWDGPLALHYYLGNNYRLLDESQPQPGEIVIIGASDYNLLRKKQLLSCQRRDLISSGTFACTVSN